MRTILLPILALMLAVVLGSELALAQDSILPPQGDFFDGRTFDEVPARRKRQNAGAADSRAAVRLSGDAQVQALVEQARKRNQNPPYRKKTEKVPLAGFEAHEVPDNFR